MAAGDHPPVPDPTVLTTEQLLREVDRAKELMLAELNGLEELFKEKFHSFDRQFTLIAEQRVEQKKDTKDAVDAAFSAAKEAVKEQTTASDRAIAKSETAMLEQLKQLSATFTAAIKSVTDNVSDLKDRVGNIESLKQGAAESKTDRRDDVSHTTTIVGSVITVILFVLLVLNYQASHRTPAAPTPAVTVTTRAP